MKKKKYKDFLDGMGIEPRQYNDYTFYDENVLSGELDFALDLLSDGKYKEKLDRRVLLMLM